MSKRRNYRHKKNNEKSMSVLDLVYLVGLYDDVQLTFSNGVQVFVSQKEVVNKNMNLDTLGHIWNAINDVKDVRGNMIARLVNRKAVFGVIIERHTWYIIDKNMMRAAYCTCSECGEALPDEGTKFFDVVDVSDMVQNPTQIYKISDLGHESVPSSLTVYNMD